MAKMNKRERRKKKYKSTKQKPLCELNDSEINVYFGDNEYLKNEKNTTETDITLSKEQMQENLKMVSKFFR